LDTTGWIHFHFSLACIGGGNGNPLQCSCLENPRDGGAWWAAVYGVAQSWKRLKRLNNNLQGRIQGPPTASAKPLLCLAILALVILIFEFAMFSPTLKQEVDSCPPPLPHCPTQGKAIGDWFPVDWNSKVRKAGQLREETGPLPDHVFLTLEVKRPPRPHMRRRFQGDQWGVMSRDALPTGLCSITHLG